jgi:hypothetical protein
LELPADIRPAYANLARIAHSPADIVIDFAHLMPGETKARITSRVLMSPLSAKLLLRALSENITRYETAFGEIIIPSATLADALFKPFQQPPDDSSEGDDGKA